MRKRERGFLARRGLEKCKTVPFLSQINFFFTVEKRKLITAKFMFFRSSAKLNPRDKYGKG